MSPKYRHRGYKDSEHENERRRDKAPPRQSLTKEERIQKRSLRHAIDRDANAVVRCPKCGLNVQDLGIVQPDTLCPHCSAPMHCCRTCLHFDSSARWQCRAEIQEPVSEKTKANECTSYEPRLVLDVTGRRSNRGGPDSPRAAFDNLFKN